MLKKDQANLRVSEAGVAQFYDVPTIVTVIVIHDEAMEAHFQ